MGRACRTNGEKRNAFRILVAKPKGGKPAGGPNLRWVNTIQLKWILERQDRKAWDLI
jgi:hypothetical protein